MATGRAGTDIELLRGEAAEPRKAAAYHAVPVAGRGKGVLVVDETGALTDFARDACDRLARAGFAALAPDLAGAPDPEPLLAAGVRRLLDDDATEGPRVAALGFAEGGVLALLEGVRNRRIGCVVACYALPGPAHGDDLASLEAPALLIFGSDDPRVASGSAAELEGTLASARLRVESGAGEGFMNASRADCYAATPAAAAWDATLAFLGAGL